MTASLMSRILPHANDNHLTPPPTQAQVERNRKAMLALQALERLHGILASRPNPQYRDVRLERSACEHECDHCYMECAVAPKRIEWWEGELAKACGTTAVGRA